MKKRTGKRLQFSAPGATMILYKYKYKYKYTYWKKTVIFGTFLLKTEFPGHEKKEVTRHE